MHATVEEDIIRLKFGQLLRDVARICVPEGPATQNKRAICLQRQRLGQLARRNFNQSIGRPNIQRNIRPQLCVEVTSEARVIPPFIACFSVQRGWRSFGDRRSSDQLARRHTNVVLLLDCLDAAMVGRLNQIGGDRARSFAPASRQGAEVFLRKQLCELLFSCRL